MPAWARSWQEPGTHFARATSILMHLDEEKVQRLLHAGIAAVGLSPPGH